MTQVLEKPVAILGGGAYAQTFAADFTLAGYKVRLYELPEFAQGTLGESIDDLSFELVGVPGWGTYTFLACRLDKDTFLCYWAEGTATEKSTIRV